MARFFKYLFHLLLIAYIAIVLALVIPPLLGFTTATVMENTEANQPVGTVNYAKRIPLQDLQIGEKILVTGSDSVHVYTVQNVNAEQSVVAVADSDLGEIPVRSYVYKMAYSVPFIGYVIIALQSMEGVIVLAMIAVLLLLLCILTSVWSRKVKEKKKRQAEREREKKAAEKRAAELAEKEAEEFGRAEERGRVMNARAEAYFAARQAESNRPAPIEEYEDFPPKEETPAEKDPLQAVTKPVAADFDYFDDDEEDEEADSWLHDDVDDDDLFAGLNNKAATESLMATARLFAINRASQLKEQMAQKENPTPAEKVEKPEEMQKTRVLSEDTSSVKTQQQLNIVADSQGITAVPSENKDLNVKRIAVDKVINLKELRDLDEDTQQIVLTINIKVVSE